MDTQAAKAVHDKESLQAFLRANRQAAQFGLQDEIDYVAVNKKFELTLIVFKEKAPAPERKREAIKEEMK